MTLTQSKIALICSQYWHVTMVWSTSVTPIFTDVTKIFFLKRFFVFLFASFNYRLFISVPFQSDLDFIYCGILWIYSDCNYSGDLLPYKKERRYVCLFLNSAFFPFQIQVSSKRAMPNRFLVNHMDVCITTTFFYDIRGV